VVLKYSLPKRLRDRSNSASVLAVFLKHVSSQMCFCAWWQREQADAADQGVSEQFDQPSVYDRARVSGHSRLQRDAAGPAAGQPHPETSHSPKNILQGTCLTHCIGPHHYPTSSFMFSLLTALARPLLSLLLGRPPLSTSLRLPDRSFRYVSLFSAIRAVARILVRGVEN